VPIIQNSVSVAAGATNDNVLQGSQFEYLPYNALVEFGLNGSATGLLADVYSGQDILAESMLMTAQNRVPVYPDDYSLTDVAAAGERLKIRIRNPTGGAITAFFSARITQLS
jgi:hypothetical protein